MTIIAWDGKTLAADKRCTFKGLAITVTKIYRVGGMLVGVSGFSTGAREMVAWIADGRKPAEFPPSQRDKDQAASIYVIEADGRINFYEQGPYPLLLEEKCAAMGSGRDFALAAMYLGKTAREAVEVACHFEVGCGNGVDELTL